MSIIQDDEEIKKNTPTKLQRALSAQASDFLEGWLEIPNKGNIRKYGWVQRYCVLDSDRLAIFIDEASAREGQPEYGAVNKE